jgi:hypothetical protein
VTRLSSFCDGSRVWLANLWTLSAMETWHWSQMTSWLLYLQLIDCHYLKNYGFDPNFPGRDGRRSWYCRKADIRLIDSCPWWLTTLAKFAGRLERIKPPIFIYLLWSSYTRYINMHKQVNNNAPVLLLERLQIFFSPTRCQKVPLDYYMFLLPRRTVHVD